MVEDSKTINEKFLVVGPGAIGSAVAASLGSAGIEVKILGREHHKKHFAKNEVIYKRKDKTLKAKLAAITIDDLKNGDFTPDAVLITLKANHTIAFMKELEQAIDNNTIIVSMQNGLTGQEIYDNTNFKNVYACVIGFNVYAEAVGQSLQTSEGDLVVGKVLDSSDKSKTDNVPEFIVEAFQNIAPTKVSDNITGDVWMKAMINSTINPICAIGDMKLGDLPKSSASLTLALWTWSELVDVAKAAKVKLNPFQGKLYPEVLYAYDIVSYGIARNVIEMIVGEHKDAIVSMLQDIRNKKETEIDFLNGKIYSIGKQYNVKMPVNELLIDTIKKLEKQELRASKGLVYRLYRQIVLK